NVPIWFTLIKMELPIPFSIPSANFSVFVTNKSSPTNCTRSPIRSVNSWWPSQSSSSNPSSIRSEEHTSELQSRFDLVCRLLLERSLAHPDLHSFPTRRSSDLNVPIWFTLIKMELPIPFSIPSANFSVFVTNKSSPTNCTRSPIRSVNSWWPSQSSSSNPSSIEIIGYFSTNCSYQSTISADVLTTPSPAN